MAALLLFEIVFPVNAHIPVKNSSTMIPKVTTAVVMYCFGVIVTICDENGVTSKVLLRNPLESKNPNGVGNRYFIVLCEKSTNGSNTLIVPKNIADSARLSIADKHNRSAVINIAPKQRFARVSNAAPKMLI